MDVTTQNFPPVNQLSEIAQFVADTECAYLLDRPARTEGDRRKVERLKLTIPVELTLLDTNLQPDGYLCHAVTRDLSILGTGLVSHTPIASRYVLLTFRPFAVAAFNAVCKVVYCNEVGYYYQIGCEFVTADAS